MTNRIFFQMLEDENIPLPETEYEFSDRNWRLDYFWPAFGLALEIEGGVWTHGRHSRPSGFVKDMEKYNTLACWGYRLIRVQPKELLTGNTMRLIREAIYG